MTPTAALDFTIEVMKDRQRALHARSTRRHLAIDDVVCKLEDIRTRVVASTEPPPIDLAAQGGDQPRGPLRGLVTLHDDVTIGHRGDDFDGLETVMWCDTCDQLISTEPTVSTCHTDHPMAPYRYQRNPQEPPTHEPRFGTDRP